MALFDYPRIHFRGTAEINPSTLNNCTKWPLTFYDPVRSEAFFPPRLYFDSTEAMDEVQATFDPPRYHDHHNGFPYIEIDVFPNIEAFHSWCGKPLCQNASAPDWDYLPFYKMAEHLYHRKWVGDFPPLMVDLLNTPPGYWNMHGDMTVKLSDVHATGVQVLEQTGTGQQIRTYTNGDQNLPPKIGEWLNLELDFCVPGSRKRTAVICDLIGNQAIFTNLFCSGLKIRDRRTQHVVLEGTPYRFSPMYYAAWKVWNWRPPMASAGRFCSAIPLDRIVHIGPELKDWFSAADNRELTGITVSMVIEQTFQNRYDPGFYVNGGRSNPATSTVLFTVCPRYAGDLRSNEMGRLLSTLNTGSKPAAKAAKPLPTMRSGVRTYPDGSGIFSVDMACTWPEELYPPPTESSPGKPQGSSFETWELGALSFRYGSDPNTEFFRISVTRADHPLESVLARGGLFDCPLTPDQVDQLTRKYISVYLEEELLFRETEYHITSDTKGLYGEAGESPDAGYRIYDHRQEPCVLRVLQRGVPVNQPITVHLGVYHIPVAGNNPRGPVDRQETIKIQDGSVVQLTNAPLQPEDTAVYCFAYDGQYPNNRFPPFFGPGGYHIMDTGAFVALNVLANRDYSAYLDRANWGTTPPDWSVVYQEVFRLFHIVFPVMGTIIPFEQGQYESEYVLDHVMDLTAPDRWNDVRYMPSNRELSKNQRALIEAWAEYVRTRPPSA